jgi:hypothetical protein
MRHLFTIDPEDLHLQVHSHTIEIVMFTAGAGLAASQHQAVIDTLKCFPTTDLAIYLVNGAACAQLSGYANPMLVYNVLHYPALIVLSDGHQQHWSDDDGPSEDWMPLPDDADLLIERIDRILDAPADPDDSDEARARASFSHLE